VVEGAALSSSREAMLGRIRASLAGGPPAPELVRSYRRTGELVGAALIDRLCDRVGDYRAEVRRVAATDLPLAIAHAFESRSARRVGIPAGIPAGWRPSSLELVVDDGLSTSELAGLDGVLTGCTLAIAETGTIVLTSGPTEGTRALTLVPDLHVCVVDEAQVVELVPAAIAALDELVGRDRRPVTFVSGPSATSDIELSRVEGVHGPRDLVVLVTRQEAS
jgi:L-lactate dehydrogenase complex protein LldG